MSIFNFLSNQSLAANAEVKPVNRALRPSVSKNPTNADIRVFRSGAVYPSLALIEKDSLQYLDKEEEGVANGYDVTDSSKFLNTQSWEKSVVFISLIAKTAAKVDLFGRTVYTEEGKAGDVAVQGAATFGKDLLDTLKSVYDYEIPEGENFVDLKIVEDFDFSTPDNIYYLPKVVSRGEKKGQIDLIRRENIKLNLLIPVSMLEGNTDADALADGTDAMAEEVSVDEFEEAEA